MLIQFSTKCKKELSKIKRSDKIFFKKIKKQLNLFSMKPNHPSLRLHKLSGGQAGCWSISIDKSYRMLYYYREIEDEKSVVSFTIGTHKQVYV